MELDTDFLCPGFKKLDQMALGAPAEACLFCSTPAQITVTKADRERIAERISAGVKEFFLEVFEQGDTVMGYTKAEQES
jgi:hypothetical protein